MAMADQTFTLESRSIEALPLVNHLLDRLRLGALLTQHVPAGDRRQRLAPATAPASGWSSMSRAISPRRWRPG